MPRKTKTLLWKGEHYAADDPSKFPDQMKAAMQEKQERAAAKAARLPYTPNPELLKAMQPPKPEATPQAAPAPAVAEPEEKSEGADAGSVDAKEGGAQALPTDFPAFASLDKAGFKDLAAVVAASDDDLLALPNIGPAKLKEIRAAQEEA